MSLSINSNSAASSILSNLNNVQNEMNTSYQQLSTGNQVSSAADNPASYAISQQMTSQINGLNQATQNAQNGISMIQTATGAMNQIEQVMQTMSTLATEASNSGNTFSDRANLQLEMNALAQQINSTTNQTQYNGINLLTGQFGTSGTGTSNLNLQIGANQGQTLSFNIGATDAQSLGIAGTTATGVAGYTVSSVTGTGTMASVNAGANPDNILQGEQISSNSLLQSGMNLQVVFNASEDTNATDVYNTANNAAQQILNGDQNTPGSYQNMIQSINTTLAADGQTLSAQNQTTLNNQLTSAFQQFYSNPGASNALNTLAYSVAGALSAAGITDSTGSSGTPFTDVMNQVFGSGNVTVATGGTGITGSVTSSNGGLIATTASDIESAINSAVNGLTGPQQTSITSYYAGTDAGTNLSALLSGASTVSGTLQLQTSDGTNIGNAVSLANITPGASLTIGDTATGATMSVTVNSTFISDLTSQMSGPGASGTFTQIDSFTTTGTSNDENNPGTGNTYVNTAGSENNGWQSNSNISGINIMTQQGAQSAITAIQGAINNLSSSQAQLGAVQNRLNYTVSNLNNSSQNLSNAQSTITNTDMAAAYTQFSQQQVLEQVGISMLSQAQQQPQMILKLLQ